MAYNNRLNLLRHTLKTITNSIIKDYEIIIVDDCSKAEERVECLISEFKNIEFNIIRLEKSKRWYCNPCIPYNIGFRQIKGNIVIIQNPECAHNGDILDHAVKNINSNNYLVYSAYSLDQSDTNSLLSGHKIKLHQWPATVEGVSGWYAHKTINPRPYHFCSCITKDNLYDLGGFDERFAKGIAYDDDEFVKRISRKKLNISFCNDPFVFHQFHYSTEKDLNNSRQDNKKLFEVCSKENIIKAQKL
jgi:glycosyltransferase involved in cell wall biosynthesis